jgi:hypothetical protein
VVPEQPPLHLPRACWSTARWYDLVRRAVGSWLSASVSYCVPPLQHEMCSSLDVDVAAGGRARE